MLLVPTSPGEFLDKVTILEIKSERITDPAKLAHVHHELAVLRAAWAASPLADRDVAELSARLKQVNEALWDIEDRIRDKEAARAFDAEFIERLGDRALVGDAEIHALGLGAVAQRGVVEVDALRHR